jgi:hypothetical protein
LENSGALRAVSQPRLARTLWRNHMTFPLTALLLTTALTTALASPALARPVTLTTNMAQYGSDGTYLALYVTDGQGAYMGSLWMAEGKSKYYEHLRV